jgi:DNA-binding transcriptional MocR family regulator
MVQRLLEEELAGTGMGHWTTPRGGYFVQFNSRPGLAKAIVEMAAAIGVKLTPAGATWPYGEDPEDSDIRLAPTFPALEEVE